MFTVVESRLDGRGSDESESPCRGWRHALQIPFWLAASVQFVSESD